MEYIMDKQRAIRLQKALLGWYDENKRDLPWRHTTEPYQIWVCEVMAQQTKINALLPYFRRFMLRFPTVELLANAKEEEVLKVWEGLGYYARAKNLHKASMRVMKDFGGRIPSTKQELLSIEGIGEYTAGAILSIAFGQRAPAVDGNVLRIFARIESSALDIALAHAKDIAGGFVLSMMPSVRTGCFTQALMEIGALVCTPKNPNCTACPAQRLCRAYAKGMQHKLPIKSKKAPPRHLEKTVLIIRNEAGQVLLKKRTEKLLGGLWEYYIVERKMDSKKAKQFVKALGYIVESVVPIGPAQHVFTHLVWHMEGYYCKVKGNDLPPDYVFLDLEVLDEIPMPTALSVYTNYLSRNLE